MERKEKFAKRFIHRFDSRVLFFRKKVIPMLLMVAATSRFHGFQTIIIFIANKNLLCELIRSCGGDLLPLLIRITY